MSKRESGRKARKLSSVSKSRKKATKEQVSATSKRIAKTNKAASKSIKKTSKELKVAPKRDSLGRFTKVAPKKSILRKRVMTNDKSQAKKQSNRKTQPQVSKKAASGKKRSIPSRPKKTVKVSTKKKTVKKTTTKQAVKKTVKKATKAGRETKKQTKQIGKSARAAKKFVKAIASSKKSGTKQRTSKRKASRPSAKKRGSLSGKRGSGKKQSPPKKRAQPKAAKKQASSKPPKQGKRFVSSRPRVDEREKVETTHLSVVRSYQIRALPDESRRALYGTLEDLKADAPRLQSLLKPGDYWGFRLNGGNSYQLFDTVQQLIKRLSEYTIYTQFAKNRSKDYREIFNTLELVVVRFDANIPPPVPDTRIEAQREWQSNKVGELKQRKQRVRQEKKEQRRVVRQAKQETKRAVKAREKFEAKLSREQAKVEKERQRAALAEARAKAAEDRLRKLTKHKKGGKR